MPRLEACYFGPGPQQIWERLARVLEVSAREHCANWTISVQSLTPPPRRSALGIASHVHNTQKMVEWSRIVQEAADGEELLLIDADTMIVQSLDPVWDRPFDMGYTVKPSRFPFNSGVVFLRVSDRVRAFIKAWELENLRMLNDGAYHQLWRRKYGGINQASLGALLPRARGPFGLDLLELQCQEWNCEDSSWATFRPDVARIVHIKSGLRRAVFGRERMTPALRPLVTRWHAIEQSVQERATA